MRKSIFNLVGGAFFGLLTLTFTACGNIDNPLEVISNANPVSAVVLKNLLENNSTFIVTFKLNDQEYTVTFTKNEDGEFEYETSSNLDLNSYALDLLDNGLLRLSIMDDPENEHFVSNIIFDLNDNTYSIVNNIGGGTTFDGKVSVNGTSGTLKTSCPDKATILISYGLPPTSRTRALYPDDTQLVVYYNKEKNETWKDVAKRYGFTTFSGVLTIKDIDPNEEVEYWVVRITDDDVPAEGSTMYENTDAIVEGVSYIVRPDDKVGIRDGNTFSDSYVADLWLTGVLSD